MISEQQQPINDEVERCAKNFWFVEQVASKPKQTPCYIDHNFTVIFKRPVISDREIVQEVITLAERVLVCPEYVPDQAVLKKLQDGVQGFITRSTELSPEEKEQGPETIYLVGLLQDLIPGKCEHIASLKDWRQQVQTSTIASLLGKKVTYYDTDDMGSIEGTRNFMYCCLRFLSTAVEFAKRYHYYFNDSLLFQENSKFILTKSNYPEEEFCIDPDFEHLFAEIDLFALRMKTASILRTRGKIGEDVLARHVQKLLDLKRHDSSKSAAVDNCLSAMRYVNLDSGEGLESHEYKNTLTIWELFQQALRWSNTGDHQGLRDSALKNVITVMKLATNFISTTKRMEGLFNRHIAALFKSGQHDTVRKMIYYQASRSAFLWSMIGNIIQHITPGMNADSLLYKQLHEKMVQHIGKLPSKREQKRATHNELNTFKIAWSSCDEVFSNLSPEEVFSNLSPEDYARQVNSILAYNTPIVTAVDRLVQMTTKLLDDDQVSGKVSDLTSTIKVLSLKDTTQQMLLSTKPRSSKTKNRRQQKQQKQQKATNRVAKGILAPILPSSEEDAPIIITSTPSPMILPSEGPWQTKPLHAPKVAHSPFTYHGRVNRWFDPMQNPFVDDPTYAGQDFSPHAQAWIRVRHAFGFMVDECAKQYGIVHEDKDGKRIILVGQISIEEECHRGVFLWAFGKGKNRDVCHHRFFSKKTDNEIIDEYARQGFYQLDIPPEEQNLQEAPIQKPVKNRKLFEDESSIEEESAYKIVINDPKNNAVITLCRLND